MVQVSIRVDPIVLAALKASGSGWQKRLREAIERTAKTRPRKFGGRPKKGKALEERRTKRRA